MFLGVAIEYVGYMQRLNSLSVVELHQVKNIENAFSAMMNPNVPGEVYEIICDIAHLFFEMKDITKHSDILSIRIN